MKCPQLIAPNLTVARTLSTWSPEHGCVATQVAKTSSEAVSIPLGLVLGTLFTVTILDPAKLRVNAVAESPLSPVELRKAK